MTGPSTPEATGQDGEGRPGKRLNERHIRRHAERAIARRLAGAPTDGTIRSITYVGHDMLVNLNSGGNAIEVEAELRGRGYNVMQGGGCTVRVISP